MLCETFHTEVLRVNWEVTDTRDIICVHLQVSSHGLRSFLMNGLTVMLCWNISGVSDRLKMFVDYSVSSYEYNIQMVSAMKVSGKVVNM